MRGYSYISLIMGLVQCVDLNAQGTFRNMDFELSQIPQTQPPGLVSTSLALPNWTVSFGTVEQSVVRWQQFSVGSTEVSLAGTSGSVTSIDGGYSAQLFGGNTAPDASISQTGTVPANAHSLVFKAQVGGPGQQLFVSVGGTTLPLFDLLNGPNYTLYGVDVSQFAGSQEELKFSAAWNFQGPTPGPSYWNVDDIVFSTAVVPEPCTTVLFLAAVLFTRGVFHLRRNYMVKLLRRGFRISQSGRGIA